MLRSNVAFLLVEMMAISLFASGCAFREGPPCGDVTIKDGAGRDTVSYGTSTGGAAGGEDWGHDSTVADTTYSLDTIYYATNRQLVGRIRQSLIFPNGADFEDPNDSYGQKRGRLSYGACQVSIPRKREVGTVSRPSIIRLEFCEDPSKHVMIWSTTKLAGDDFYARVASRVDDSPRLSSFIFVHGYNTSFEEAARRTAQISYDLGFNGASAFYSWPSLGGLEDYPADEDNADWAVDDLKFFLSEYSAMSGAADIVVIGHSMGCLALSKALSQLARERPEMLRSFSEIILTAPDIDADVFKSQLAPAMIAVGAPITLYASSADDALKASHRFHQNPRAGEAGHDLVIMSGIETIDASDVPCGFLCHSYFAEVTSVLTDIGQLVKERLRANRRASLLEVTLPVGKYWHFSP